MPQNGISGRCSENDPASPAFLFAGMVLPHEFFHYLPVDVFIDGCVAFPRLSSSFVMEGMESASQLRDKYRIPAKFAPKRGHRLRRNPRYRRAGRKRIGIPSRLRGRIKFRAFRGPFDGFHAVLVVHIIRLRNFDLSPTCRSPWMTLVISNVEVVCAERTLRSPGAAPRPRSSTSSKIGDFSLCVVQEGPPDNQCGGFGHFGYGPWDAGWIMVFYQGDARPSVPKIAR